MLKTRPTPVLCLFALAALIVTSTSWARQPPSREQMEQQAAQRMEELRTRLELTGEQDRQIEPILAAGIRQGRELHEKLLPIWNAIFSDNLPANTRYCMELQGRQCGVPRPPMPTTSKQQQGPIREALATAGIVQ